MSPASFEYLRTLVAELSAIALDDEKKYLVESRLMPLAHRVGLNSIDDLVHKLRVAPSKHLRQQVVDAMTTNETSFFRDTVPFETLRKIILPELVARREGKKTLNIWSAACASGQEPYSIALLWREHFSHLHDWSIRLLATDISGEVLQRARDGRFTQTEVQRGLPDSLLQKYFRPAEGQWVLDPTVCRMVDFRQLNLSGNWPTLPMMDVILMRNVLVYFNAVTRQEIFRKVRQLLRTDGYLLLGGAETALNIDASFHVTRGNGFSYYRLKNK